MNIETFNTKLPFITTVTIPNDGMVIVELKCMVHTKALPSSYPYLSKHHIFVINKSTVEKWKSLIQRLDDARNDIAQISITILP